MSLIEQIFGVRVEPAKTERVLMFDKIIRTQQNGWSESTEQHCFSFRTNRLSKIILEQIMFDNWGSTVYIYIYIYIPPYIYIYINIFTNFLTKSTYGERQNEKNPPEFEDENISRITVRGKKKKKTHRKMLLSYKYKKCSILGRAKLLQNLFRESGTNLQTL